MENKIKTIDELRENIINRMGQRGVSAYRLAKETGVDESSISRFLGGGDIKGRNLVPLISFFDYLIIAFVISNSMFFN